jgi:hypothetical protein
MSTYGPIREIPAPPDLRRATVWGDLCGELLLRLEQTNARYALQVPLHDAPTARHAQNALIHLFRRHVGRGAVCVKRIEDQLIVSRGRAWGR